jgi:hypothetical protein
MELPRNAVGSFIEGTNKYFEAELETGYVVIGDHQYYLAMVTLICMGTFSREGCGLIEPFGSIQKYQGKIRVLIFFPNMEQKKGSMISLIRPKN